MSDNQIPDKQTAGLLPEDEGKNPVFCLGRAMAGFMLLVWTGVPLLVPCLVFRFWFT